MYNFPIGAMLESFRTDRSTAIKKAAGIGAKGIQMYATQGEKSPENLDSALCRLTKTTTVTKSCRRRALSLPAMRTA